VRLPAVETGHKWYVRGFFAVIRTFSGREPPDILKTLYYRPAFLGLRFGVLTQEIMRGDSEWSVGEREIFAAFTSSLNQCLF
jgi:hypothetical protein